MTDSEEILDRITPNGPRRVMATGALGSLGALLLWLVLSTPPAGLGFLLLLLVIGTGSLWLSWRLWQASGTVLELTREELREEGGRLIARIDNIDKVDRGFFAFKPAAGFRLSMQGRMSSVYAPGLWWRRGRTVMVGGVTSRAQAKAVADLISILIAQQRGEL